MKIFYFCLNKAKESWEMDLNEKLDLAAGVKTKGNNYFKVRSQSWESFTFEQVFLFFFSTSFLVAFLL